MYCVGRGLDAAPLSSRCAVCVLRSPGFSGGAPLVDGHVRYCVAQGLAGRPLSQELAAPKLARWAFVNWPRWAFQVPQACGLQPPRSDIHGKAGRRRRQAPHALPFSTTRISRRAIVRKVKPSRFANLPFMRTIGPLAQHSDDTRRRPFPEPRETPRRRAASKTTQPQHGALPVSRGPTVRGPQSSVKG